LKLPRDVALELPSTTTELPPVVVKLITTSIVACGCSEVAYHSELSIAALKFPSVAVEFPRTAKYWRPTMEDPA
jgi:hypothetical protein